MSATLFSNPWGKERSFNRPSVLEPIHHGALVDSMQIRHVRERKSVSVDSKPSGVSSVALLNFPCRPPAVRGLVISKHVDSVNGHSGWARPHVFKKILKAFHPSRAHFNASCSIHFVIFIGRAGASRFHGIPNYELGGCTSKCRMSMGHVFASVNVDGEASTGFRSPCSKDAVTNPNLISAITKAVRIGHSGPAFPFADNWLRHYKKSAKPLSVVGYGFFRHETIKQVLQHSSMNSYE